MALFKPFRGNKSNLPSNRNDGAVYVTEDSLELFFDTSLQRIKITDVIEVDTDFDLPLAPLNKFYFSLDSNKLFKYNNGEWQTIGISDYNDLTNRPSISGVTLTGNKTLADLNIQEKGDYALKSDLTNVVYIDDLTGDSGDVVNINAGFLDNKNADYYKNISGTYNAIATYSSNKYTLTLTDTGLTVSPNFFSLRFVAPNAYASSSTFVFSSVTYTAINAAFEKDQVVLAHFNKTAKKVYFTSGSSGSGASTAADISVSTITSKEDGSTVIQEAGDLQTVLYTNINSIHTTETTLNNLVNTNLPAIISDISDLQNHDKNYCPFVIQASAPTDTKLFWVDSSSTPNVLRYYNGSAWVGVVGVWGS